MQDHGPNGHDAQAVNGLGLMGHFAQFHAAHKQHVVMPATLATALSTVNSFTSAAYVKIRSVSDRLGLRSSLDCTLMHRRRLSAFSTTPLSTVHLSEVLFFPCVPVQYTPSMRLWDIGNDEANYITLLLGGGAPSPAFMGLHQSFKTVGNLTQTNSDKSYAEAGTW